MTQPLFTVTNKHAAVCGVPTPHNGDDLDCIISYFEGSCGDQWLFVYRRSTDTAIVQGGDIGWAEARPVIDGAVPSLVMGQAERTWVLACWLTVGKPMPVLSISKYWHEGNILAVGTLLGL